MMPKKRNAALCPLLRDIGYTIEHMYIGRMLIKEFDTVDLFIVHEVPMTYDHVSSQLGWNRESGRRYLRTMKTAGVLDVVGKQEYSETVIVPQHAHKTTAKGYQAEHEAKQQWLKDLIGPTMKGLMMWHDALGEEWDWEKYEGQRWVSS